MTVTTMQEDYDANSNNDATARFHRLTWSLGKINEKQDYIDKFFYIRIVKILQFCVLSFYTWKDSKVICDLASYVFVTIKEK